MGIVFDVLGLEFLGFLKVVFELVSRMLVVCDVSYV